MINLSNMVDIVDTDCPEKFYITDKGCIGILRRKYEHNAGMNTRLEAVLKDCSDKEELKKLGTPYTLYSLAFVCHLVSGDKV